MTIYKEWGFQTTPFDPTALAPDESGDELLVGRESEVDALTKRIQNPPKLTTVEGPNGVGKTSLINVSAYRLRKRQIEEEAGTLLIPCKEVFQLSPESDVHRFIDYVLVSVAQTLIPSIKDLRKVGRDTPDVETVSAWLNSPEVKGWSAALNIGSVGVNLGSDKALNTGTGFASSGLRRQVFEWLATIFPAADTGGVLCLIDNLELLRTSENARSLLEQLRDEVLTRPGLRWVLSGATGITFGIAASPRLQGLLHSPIEVGRVDDKHAKDILPSRIRAFAVDPSSAYLPIHHESFVRLYGILRGNLRSTLGNADDYCMWASDRQLPETDDDKRSRFEEWLSSVAKDCLDAVSDQVKPRAWQVFDEAVKMGGLFSPSDHTRFGFESSQTLRPHIRDLEVAGLVQSAQDDSDRRRKTIVIMPKGWLVNHARSS